MALASFDHLFKPEHSSLPIFASFGDGPIPLFRVVFVTDGSYGHTIETRTAALAGTVAAALLAGDQRREVTCIDCGPLETGPPQRTVYRLRGQLSDKVISSQRFSAS